MTTSWEDVRRDFALVPLPAWGIRRDGEWEYRTHDDLSVLLPDDEDLSGWFFCASDQWRRLGPAGPDQVFQVVDALWEAAMEERWNTFPEVDGVVLAPVLVADEVHWAARGVPVCRVGDLASVLTS